MGFFDYAAGNWNDAIENWRRATDAYRRSGNMVNAALGVSNSAELLINQRRYDEAEPLVREAIEIWAAAEYPALADALCNSGKLALYRGNLAEADAIFSDVHARLVEGSGGIVTAQADSWRAECWLLQGRVDDAIALITAALEAEASAGDATYTPRLLRLRGNAEQARGACEAARADFERSLEVARTHKAEYDVALALDALCALQRSLDRDVDIAMEQERDALFARFGVMPEAGDRAQSARR